MCRNDERLLYIGMDDAIAINIQREAFDLLDALENAGFEAWFVGGCVRDAIMGRSINDVDIACSAHWADSKHALERSGIKVVETGTQHGTITAILENGASFEITTYRSDSTYSDCRHPDHVEFVSSIEEDLKRRDFTMNAMAWHPVRGLIDIYGGVNDIESKLIRTVGDPVTRFHEDALRILRACRFSSQLGFAIEGETFQAMQANKCYLDRVSAERVTHELDELLLGDHVHDALLATVNVLAFVVPELVAMKDCPQNTKYHKYDVLEHTAYVIQNSPATRLSRWAALCHDMGKPAAGFYENGVEHFYNHGYLSVVIARGMLKRMAMSDSFIADVLVLVRDHDRVKTDPDPRLIRRALYKLNGRVDLFEALLDIKRADALSQSELALPKLERLDEVRPIFEKVLEEDQAFMVKDLAINGNDLIALGFIHGKIVGETLDKLIDLVIDQKVPNDREALLAKAAEWL